MDTQYVSSERLISRSELAKRWSCSVQTLKRRTRDGTLHPIRFNQRFLRYKLSEVARIEQEAAEDVESRPDIDQISNITDRV